VSISEADIKLLWGRAAGFCSRPGCGIDLTRLPEASKAYSVGEMAHVIARSAGGPRGDGTGGGDTYDNLILLCPTDHRDVDKAEGEFPPELLHEWKRTHEARTRAFGSEQSFQSAEALGKAVRALLAKNHAIWREFGPASNAAQNDPVSNVHALWELRRADRIVPNNRTIMNMVGANESLLTEAQLAAFAEFCVHAESFEVHVHSAIDTYPLFPPSFAEAFSHEQ
jgi:hypothetical protein